LLAFGGILAGSLTLPGHIRINLALFLCSLAFSGYLAEVMLISKKASHWLQMDSKDTQAGDTRSRLQLIDDLRRQGVNAYPAVIPKHLVKEGNTEPTRVDRSVITVNGVETVPLAGIARVFTVFCKENGEYATYSSDGYGFNNPSEIWEAPRIDIVALGDSNTHGACVSPGKSFVGRIREHYPATLNLGISGNGPLTMLAALREYTQRHQPKIILWCYYEGNDLDDLSRERFSPILMEYLNDSFNQGLLSRQAEIDKALINYVNESVNKMRERLKARMEWERERVRWEPILKLHHLRQFLVAAYQRYKQREDDQNYHRSLASRASEEEFELFRKVLIEADTAVRTWGGQLYFAYLPQWARYANPELANKNRERVLSMVETLGFTIMDLHPAFAEHKDPLALFSFRISAAGHYSEDGYQLVAEEILRVISKTDTSPSG
jgi:hypothetical protein